LSQWEGKNRAKMILKFELDRNLIKNKLEFLFSL
jgi:hypothetical protein